MDYITVGERIKNLRELNKMSQQELAIKTGFSDKSSISKIEKNQFELSKDKAEAIAKALGVTPIYLYGWDSYIEDDEFQHGLADAELIKSMASVKLSKKEKKLVEIYQLLSNKNQNTLEMVSEALLIAQLSPAIEEYQALLNKSNDESE